MVYGSARYLLYCATPRIAIVDVTLELRAPTTIVVQCVGRGFTSQGTIEDVPAIGYDDWKHGAVLGARCALRILELSTASVVIQRIQGLTTDTTPAAVAAATILAIFGALGRTMSETERATIDEIVRHDDLRRMATVADV